MAKLKKGKPLNRKSQGVKPEQGKIKKKGKAKRKSIHANTFEERQENRRRKEEFLSKKQKRKEIRAAFKIENRIFIKKVVSWAKNNPTHSSVVTHPTQEGLQSKIQSPNVQRNFKAMVRALPPGTTNEELDEHFFKRGVNIDCIRLLVHRMTEKCLGRAFLEFKTRLEYEKALNLNLSRLRGSRIVVEGSLRNLILSNKKPKKLLSYTPPPRNAPMDVNQNQNDKERSNRDAVATEKEQTNVVIQIE